MKGQRDTNLDAPKGLLPVHPAVHVINFTATVSHDADKARDRFTLAVSKTEAHQSHINPP